MESDGETVKVIVLVFHKILKNFQLRGPEKVMSAQ